MSETESDQGENPITDADILDVIHKMEPSVATTTEVANVLGVSTETARRRLKALREQGVLQRRDLGPVFLWWEPRGTVTRPDPIDMGETNALEETEASYSNSE